MKLTKQWVCVVGLLSAGGLLSGCATSPSTGTMASPTANTVSAAESCDQFGDVETILFNARASFRDGRTGQQEYSGAARLAARVLSRIPSEPGTDIASSLEALRAAAPAGKIGAMASFDPDGTTWSDAAQSLTQACSAEGFDVNVSAWTGG